MRHTPVTATWLLLTLGALSGVYCLLRTRAGSRGQRRAAGGEALMGFGTAAMAVPAALGTVPRAAWAVGAAVFGATALRALWDARNGSDAAHHLHHLVGAGAMAYMAVAMAARPVGHGHGGAGIPLLTGALFGYFAVYVLWAGARLVPVTAVTPAAPVTPVAAVAPGPAGPVPDPADRADGAGTGRSGWTHRPELTRACRIAMGLAMCVMLPTL
ncbi:DUF5134 domain-containing protein [Streptomyces sp. JNUCC 64]